MRNSNYSFTFFDLIANLLIGERLFYFLTGQLISKYKKFNIIPGSEKSETEDKFHLKGSNNSIEPDSDLLNKNYSKFRSGINLLSSETPEQFSLYQNYPNPFISKTFINFQCPSLSFISIKIYDINWKEVSTLVYGKQTPGTYQIEFENNLNNSDKLPDGIYFYRMDSENFTDTKKMFIVS